MTDCTWPECGCPERDTCRKAKPADYAELIIRLEETSPRQAPIYAAEIMKDAAAAIRSYSWLYFGSIIRIPAAAIASSISRAY